MIIGLNWTPIKQEPVDKDNWILVWTAEVIVFDRYGEHADTFYDFIYFAPLENKFYHLNGADWREAKI